MKIIAYKTLGKYLKKGGESALPISIVSGYLGVSSSAVTARIKKGNLDAIKIGKTTLVTVSSINKIKKKWKNDRKIVWSHLIAAAKRGDRVISYSEIMGPINLEVGIPAHRNQIGQILGELSYKSYKESETLISVLVHRKNTGIPGPGFFDLLEGGTFYGKLTDYKSKSDLVKGETDRVLEFYDASAE